MVVQANSSSTDSRVYTYSDSERVQFKKIFLSVSRTSPACRNFPSQTSPARKNFGKSELERALRAKNLSWVSLSELDFCWPMVFTVPFIALFCHNVHKPNSPFKNPYFLSVFVHPSSLAREMHFIFTTSKMNTSQSNKKNSQEIGDLPNKGLLQVSPLF